MVLEAKKTGLIRNKDFSGRYDRFFWLA